MKRFVTIALVFVCLPSQVFALSADGLHQLQYDAVYYGNANSCPTNNATTTNTTTTLTGTDNEQRAFNYYVKQGLTAAQSAGIVGNFMAESGVNPTVTNSIGAHGIAQWLGPRKAALEAYAPTHTPPTEDDLTTQLDFSWLKEFNGTHSGDLQKLKATTTIETVNGVLGSAEVIFKYYEGPGDSSLPKRTTNAQQVLKLYGGGAVGGGTAPPDSSGSTATPQCGGGTVNCTNPTSSTPGLSQVRQNVVCIAQQELALWKSQPGYPTPAFSKSGYFKYSQNVAELWCADFTSWVYDQAKYPLQPDPQWRVPAVASVQAIGQKNGNFHWHPADSGYTPRPGDLAIHGSGHVNLFISSAGGINTLIGGDQGSPPYPGGSNVSSETTNNPYGSGITGYVSPD